MERDKIDDSVILHIEKVRQWLREHVQVFSDSHSVTLSEFDVDWNEFRGEFCVSLDDTTISDKFSFFLEGSGKTTFHPPMFHSPLGAPASYAAVDISPETNKAIMQGLHETIPKLRGAGINKETGQEISIYTPPEMRISTDELKDAKKKVTKNYSVIIRLESI